MLPRALLRVLATCVFIAAAACGGDGGEAGPSPTPPVPLPSPATNVTEGDLATFAYGTLDTPSVFSGVVAVTGTSGQLAAAAAKGDGPGVEAAASALASLPEGLGRRAKEAEDRIAPQGPADPPLGKIRALALDVMGQTSEYVLEVAEVAERAAAAGPADLAALGRAATDIETTGEQITTKMKLLIRSLEAWAESNPEHAAKALEQFGG